MSKIVKPFGKTVSKITIELDSSKTMRIIAVEVGSLSIVQAAPATDIPMDPVKLAMILLSVLQSVLSKFSVAGVTYAKGEATESKTDHRDGNN
jgi:hypothetical protein